jgi:predicted ferric reductase
MVAQIASKPRTGSAEPVEAEAKEFQQVGIVGWLAAAVLIGTLAAVAVLPVWLPSLSAATTGVEPKAYWYLSRSSAFVAYVMLWASMAFGLLISNKLGRLWPGAPATFDMHQLTGLLGLGFAALHALVLLGDRYIGYNLTELLVPFANTGYRPLWVGLGQVALYGAALVGLTFYVRKYIGQRTWRVIHFLSFGVFALALVHGITSGTDTGEPWAIALYWGSAAILLFLTIYRVLAARYMTSGAAARR